MLARHHVRRSQVLRWKPWRSSRKKKLFIARISKNLSLRLKQVERENIKGTIPRPRFDSTPTGVLLPPRRNNHLLSRRVITGTRRYYEVAKLGLCLKISCPYNYSASFFHKLPHQGPSYAALLTFILSHYRTCPILKANFLEFSLTSKLFSNI